MMRALLIGLFLSILFAVPAFAEKHVQATNCEIFVDKVTPYQGSHALRALSVYVKVLPERLDGKIAGVGFRSRAQNAHSGSYQEWSNIQLTRHFDSPDYWFLNLGLSHDYGVLNYEGVFYVRTDKDTYYWFKTESGDNFEIDRKIYDAVVSLTGRSESNPNYNPAPEAGVETQVPQMDYFNPRSCY